jgi:hypothetical protein
MQVEAHGRNQEGKMKRKRYKSVEGEKGRKPEKMNGKVTHEEPWIPCP